MAGWVSGLNRLGANEKGPKKAPQVRILHPPLRSRKFVHHLLQKVMF